MTLLKKRSKWKNNSKKDWNEVKIENRKWKKENRKSSEGVAPLGAKNSWLIAAGQDHRCSQNSWLVGGAHDPDFGSLATAVNKCELSSHWKVPYCIKVQGVPVIFVNYFLALPAVNCASVFFYCKIFVYSLFSPLCCTALCREVVEVWTTNPLYLTTVKPLTY